MYESEFEHYYRENRAKRERAFNEQSSKRDAAVLLVLSGAMLTAVNLANNLSARSPEIIILGLGWALMLFAMFAHIKTYWLTCRANEKSIENLDAWKTSGFKSDLKQLDDKKYIRPIDRWNLLQIIFTFAGIVTLALFMLMRVKIIN